MYVNQTTMTNCNEYTEPLLPRTKYLKHTLHLTLEEMYNGTTRKLAVNKNVVCDVCQGSGSESEIAVDYSTCEECHGLGVLIVIKRINPDVEEEMERDCELCWGKGEAIVVEDRCSNCCGRKTVPDQSILIVKVKRGTRHGQKIIYKGEGTQKPNMRPGDVIVMFEAADHPTFKRQGDDLMMTISLDLVESLCGFEKLVKTLDKRQLSISSRRGNVIQNNDLKCILGEGMPKYKNPSERGKLIIQFEINYPTSIRSRHLPSIEKCLPPRQRVDIPMDAVECNLINMDPADETYYDQNHSANQPNDEYYNQDQNYYYETHEQYDDTGIHHQYGSNEQNDHQGQYYQEVQGNYKHASEHDQQGQYYQEVQGNYKHASEHDQQGQYYQEVEGNYKHASEHDQQGQYYQEVQGNYKHASEHDQQYHHNQQGYYAHNNYHQDQVYQKEDDCESLESYDATKQYNK